MKTHGNKLFLVAVLLAGLGGLLAGRATAQTFTNLHSFSTWLGNTDGAIPYGGLTLLSNKLYGTTYIGGVSFAGTIFAVNTDGTGFTNLYTFTALDDNQHNSDGARSWATLILSGNTLYGTAAGGGIYGHGTVFAVNIDGTGFTNLHTFNGSDGSSPYAGLVKSGNTLYGTTLGGVFAVNTDGTSFTNLHNFTGSEGDYPFTARLIILGNTLYGTALQGGINGNGTVFAVNTDGTSFTVLHRFTVSDGSNPGAGLLLSGNTLYGTTQFGGGSGQGTVFAINPDGSGFTNLYNFTGGSAGYAPSSQLILLGETLYGSASGGSSGRGTLFAVNTNGTGFVILHSFAAALGVAPGRYTNSEGVWPNDGLILSGNALYGMAQNGGSAGNGTIFNFTLPIPTFAIAGSVELQAFAGSNCPVRFVASAVSGGVANYLQTNDVTLAFTNGVAAYSLTVPASTTHVSAKTAWHLRRRQAVNFTNGVATVDFTGSANLLGGDLVTVAGSTNIVDTDNLVDLSDYDTAVTDFLHSGDSNTPTGRADLTGDGIVNILDYDKLVENFLQQGDPQ